MAKPICDPLQIETAIVDSAELSANGQSIFCGIDDPTLIVKNLESGTPATEASLPSTLVGEAADRTLQTLRGVFYDLAVMTACAAPRFRDILAGDLA
jgi:hypothetical protein